MRGLDQLHLLGAKHAAERVHFVSVGVDGCVFQPLDPEAGQPDLSHVRIKVGFFWLTEESLVALREGVRLRFEGFALCAEAALP